MSLESQITALVSAANNLTSQVAGKLGEIDDRVDSVSAEFAEAIRNNGGKELFVDQQAGNDNSSGGSWESPLKSLGEVTRRMIPGGAYKVWLRNDYYIKDGKELYGPTNAHIWICGSGNPRLVVSWGGTSTEANNQNTNGSIDMSYADMLYISGVTLDIDEVAIQNMYDTGSAFSRNCLVRTNVGTSAKVQANFRFQDVDFIPFLTKARQLGAGLSENVWIFVAELNNNAMTCVFRSAQLPSSDQEASAHFFRDIDKSDYSPLLAMSNVERVFRPV